MRYPQGGGLTAERQQFREELRLKAAERFAQGEARSAIAKDLRVSVRSVQRWRQMWAAGSAVAGAGVASEAEPEAVRPAGGGAGQGAGRAWLGRPALDADAGQDGDRPALPPDLHGPGCAQAPGAQRLVLPGPGPTAMERDDDAVAGWVKEVWPCAEGSRRPVEPGSSSGSGQRVCFWVEPPEGEECLGGGDEGDVVVPAAPGAAFEVDQAEAVFEFAVVVLDAPAHLRPPHQVGDRGGGGQVAQPVAGRLWRLFGLLDEQGPQRQHSVPAAASAGLLLGGASGFLARRPHLDHGETRGHRTFAALPPGDLLKQGVGVDEAGERSGGDAVTGQRGRSQPAVAGLMRFGGFGAG
jgi:hypothetical protein